MAILVALVSQSLGRTARSADELSSCKSIGFNEFLSCSDCKDLETFVNNPDVVKECLRCCSADRQEESAQKFRAAILEYCPHSISRFPFIETFVQNKAKLYPRDVVHISERVGMIPRLVMYDENDKPTIVQILKWKTEHIEEYLEEKIENLEKQV
eukprot:jgi/Picsp_1/1925/NSC_05391-R1_15 kda selenoprotein